ncbi:uncharacterized protein AFUA_8G01820 [Aspergillus fumigatus Af293]|uniref:Uncharacterized protein n=1 Tax=Aspergillus fumigatus (strain ATCC MYA-4609 / CBS 101355 / FGSC A1100 / Af293) TaxID=330879 RepID=A4DA47_ASPFU|nr:hypothetical protein AFUA_8G01820 [Aspergillus fumigatus Af293]EBA27215.1 hypothetical protein AFUA_8G01820 [Aspergillus fumigatus Af293]KEY79039.1 hypothetical protein BA78_7364 [Aspergillus fumigatus]
MRGGIGFGLLCRNVEHYGSCNGGWTVIYSDDLDEEKELREKSKNCNSFESIPTTTKNIAEEPLQSVERFKRWKKRTEACIFAHQAELASAKSTDESGQRVSSYGEKRYGLRGTMSIELEKLRQEYKSKRENVEACQNWANESADTGFDRTRYHQISLQQAKGEAVIYQKAYGAALADAKRLCPGRTFQPATGNVSLGRVDTVVSIRDQ